VRRTERPRGHRPAARGNLGVMADPDSFIPFYREEAEALLLFLTRRTLDAEVAVELTAETFAQAWRAWPRVRTDSREEMRAWLLTIARRQLGHYLRRGRTRRAALDRLGMTLPRAHEDDLAAIESAAELPSTRARLGAALETLSCEQRDAVRMRVVDELPYGELARRLGVSEPTARARVSRGIRALQAALHALPVQQEAAP
jgi:RNA polymerase sigma factor (sigma-70 family)